MDSKVVNKLIRSEVWTLWLKMRRPGFAVSANLTLHSRCYRERTGMSFNCYPTMRGSGARLSTHRLFFLAMLAHRLERIGETDAYLQLGDKAVDDHTPERLRSRYRKWFEAIEVRLKPGSKT